MTVSAKRILWTAAVMALVLIVAATAVWIGLNKRYKAPSPMRCLPADAALVVRLGDRVRLGQLLDSVVYSSELRNVLGGDNVLALAARIDTLFGNGVIAKPALQERDLYVSYSLSADGSMSQLAASFPLVNRMEWHKAMSQLRSQDGVEVSDTSVNGHGLFLLRQKGFREPLFMAAGGGCLFASTTPNLLLSFGRDDVTTLRDDPTFATIERTITANAPASVFCNGRIFRKVDQSLAQKTGRFINTVRVVANSADWIALDYTPTPDGLSADGFIVAPHPSLDILAARENSEPINISRRIPRGVQSVEQIGPGPRGLSSSAFSSFLSSDTAGASYRTAQSEIFRQAGVDVEAMLSQVFSAELALCQYDVTRPRETAFLVVDTRGGTMAQATLAQALTAMHGGASPIAIGEIAPGKSAVPEGVIARRADAQQVSNVSIPVYAGFSDSDNLFFLNNIFNGRPIPAKLFFRYEDAIVLADDMAVLRRVLADYAVGNTLDSDPAYANLRQRFSSDCARFRTTSRPGGAAFSAISSQLTIAGRLPYISIFAEARKAQKQAVSSSFSWQTRLDTTTAGPIWAVDNHYSRLSECLAQDADNVLCLIGADGMLLWKRPIDGKIVGPVSQVDFYGNGKLQYLFTTSKSLYIIDRLGNDVGSFPISLSSPSVSGAFPASYSDGSPLRFFVGCKNGPDLFGPDARPVDGWQPLKTEAQLSDVVRHLVCGGKDFIVFNDKYAYYFADRRGAKRLSTQPLAPGHNSQMTVSKDGTYFVTTTTDGSLVRIAPSDGSIMTTKTDSIGENHIARPLAGNLYIVAGPHSAAIFDIAGSSPKLVTQWPTKLHSLDGLSSLDDLVAFYDATERLTRIFSLSDGKEIKSSKIPSASIPALGRGNDGPVVFTLTLAGEIAQTKLSR